MNDQPTPPDYTSLTFGAPYADRPYVILNMISSLDGRAVVEGTERGLGSPDDQRLMRELRFHADVVLDGAETLRVSGISSRLDDRALVARRVEAGRSPLPTAATITASGQLPLEHPFFRASDFDAVVYASARIPDERAQAIRDTGRQLIILDPLDEVRAMLRHMRTELDAGLLLLEGGPRTTGAFLEQDCVDEIFLTLGGLIVGGDSPKTIVEGTRPSRVESVLRLALVSAVPNPGTNEVYLRYARRRAT